MSSFLWVLSFLLRKESTRPRAERTRAKPTGQTSRERPDQTAGFDQPTPWKKAHGKRPAGRWVKKKRGLSRAPFELGPGARQGTTNRDAQPAIEKAPQEVFAQPDGRQNKARPKPSADRVGTGNTARRPAKRTQRLKNSPLLGPQKRDLASGTEEQHRDRTRALGARRLASDWKGSRQKNTNRWPPRAPGPSLKSRSVEEKEAPWDRRDVGRRSPK